MFSSIIIITFLLATSVRTKYWNLSATDISGSASTLIYNNSVSFVLLICNINHNITSLTNLSSNSLSPNDHEIPFLQTSLRNFYHSLSLTLFWSQLTSSLIKQFLSLPTTPSCLWTQHICLFFICSFPYHFRQRFRVCVKLFLFFRHCSKHTTSLYFRLSL